MANSFSSVQALIAQNPVLFVLIMAWVLYWKGMALWKAARKNHQAWFIVLLVLNTLGILEILYIYVFSERMKERVRKGDQ